MRRHTLMRVSTSRLGSVSGRLLRALMRLAAASQSSWVMGVRRSRFSVRVSQAPGDDDDCEDTDVEGASDEDCAAGPGGSSSGFFLQESGRRTATRMLIARSAAFGSRTRWTIGRGRRSIIVRRPSIACRRVVVVPAHPCSRNGREDRGAAFPPLDRRSGARVASGMRLDVGAVDAVVLVPASPHAVGEFGSLAVRVSR